MCRHMFSLDGVRLKSRHTHMHELGGEEVSKWMSERECSGSALLKAEYRQDLMYIIMKIYNT